MMLSANGNLYSTPYWAALMANVAFSETIFPCSLCAMWEHKKSGGISLYPLQYIRSRRDSNFNWFECFPKWRAISLRSLFEGKVQWSLVAFKFPAIRHYNWLFTTWFKSFLAGTMSICIAPTFLRKIMASLMWETFLFLMILICCSLMILILMSVIDLFTNIIISCLGFVTIGLRQ